MALPKFSNPHLLRQATQAVSRADINEDYDIATQEELHGNTEDDVLLLEGLLKRSLGEFQLDSLLSQSPPEGHRKHKRRKQEEITGTEPQEGEETVSFRLFSNAPLKAVSLKPKPPPRITVTERSYEDNDEEAERRTERAKAVAVDFDWILEQSRQPIHPLHRERSDKKMLHVKLDVQTEPLPAVMVAEIPKSTFKPASLPSSPSKLPPKERPSPHDFPSDKICCPVLSAQNQKDSDSRRRRRRRRKSQATVKRQPPSFFRPLREWGGKSAGYAMGYEGSRPVPVGSARQWRYRRDTMRSGVMSKW